jgi:hypothetical protein
VDTTPTKKSKEKSKMCLRYVDMKILEKQEMMMNTKGAAIGVAFVMTVGMIGMKGS